MGFNSVFKGLSLTLGSYSDTPALVKNEQKQAMLFTNIYMRYLRAAKTVTR